MNISMLVFMIMFMLQVASYGLQVTGCKLQVIKFLYISKIINR